MVSGSCLCGAVKFSADGPLTPLSHCHCSMCRKAHGAPFVTFTSTTSDHFEWTGDESAVARYQSSNGLERAFCRHCGSSVPEPQGSGEVYIPAGLIDDDADLVADRHIFVASQAPWHIIAGALPRHDAYPNNELPVIDREVSGEAPAGVTRGSCLCGGVAFEITESFKAVYNCHCSRCRKGRAAAHTTNGFTSASGVRFVRGEEFLREYKPPEAKFFTQSFCATCGSLTPRRSEERNLGIIPLGGLDDDPGPVNPDHIYVGSKAPWYDIADDLRQCVEGPQG